MEPTIQVGDTIFAQKLTLNLGHDVEDGQIVVFENPVAGTEHDILVKRVIAQSGQTVDLIDGVVYIDGSPLDEPYAQGSSYELVTQAPGVEVSFPYTVPDGYIWVITGRILPIRATSVPCLRRTSLASPSSAIGRLTELEPCSTYRGRVAGGTPYPVILLK